MIAYDLETLHVEITLLSPAPSHKMPFKACMARIIVVFLHHSVTFSQRLTKHKACARFERSRKVPNEFG